MNLRISANEKKREMGKFWSKLQVGEVLSVRALLVNYFLNKNDINRSL